MDESIRSFMNVVDNNNILEENDEEFIASYTRIDLLEHLLEMFQQRHSELEAEMHERKRSSEYLMGQIDMIREVVIDIQDKVNEEKASTSEASTL